jgi:hypothetical protein
VLALKAEVDELKEERDEILDNIDRIEDTLDDDSKALECLKKRSAGESCSWSDGIGNALAVKQKFLDIKNRIADFTDNTVRLLTSLLFKTILIPILFLWGLAKAVGIPWSRISVYMEPRPEKKTIGNQDKDMQTTKAAP